MCVNTVACVLGDEIGNIGTPESFLKILGNIVFWDFGKPVLIFIAALCCGQFAIDSRRNEDPTLEPLEPFMTGCLSRFNSWWPGSRAAATFIPSCHFRSGR